MLPSDAFECSSDWFAFIITFVSLLHQLPVFTFSECECCPGKMDQRSERPSPHPSLAFSFIGVRGQAGLQLSVGRLDLVTKVTASITRVVTTAVLN